MLAEPRRKPQREEADERRRRDRMLQEIALDEALANTFPASDPVSAVQPVPPDSERRSLEWGPR